MSTCARVAVEYPTGMMEQGVGDLIGELRAAPMSPSMMRLPLQDDLSRLKISDPTESVDGRNRSEPNREIDM